MTTNTASAVALKVRVDPDLAERLRNAVFHTRGLTLNAALTSGFRDVLERLEREHGGPFPERKAKRLRPGRQIE